MALRILYDSFDPAYKTPFGTVTPGQACTMTVAIPCSCQTTAVSLVLQYEGGGIFREEAFALARTEAPYEYYTLTFSLTEPGLFFYYFQIRTENESFRLLRQGRDTNMEAGDLWQLSCVSDQLPVPRDFRGRVFYQIFPDRFYQSGSCDCTEKLKPYWVHENKEDMPIYLPDENGEVLNNDFYGGNLNGIREKLPYLHQLGVRALYLNPIFMAFSTHRYDTADYSRIDPMLGTDADFKALCDAAHELDIKIILDGVFSHTGSQSTYFRQAISDPGSPYRSWYQFKHYPTEYLSWWGFKTLPTVDKSSQAFMDYIFGSEDSIVAKWLRLGADGLRLDVVDELPDAFLMKLRLRLRELNPNAFLVGEVWEDASNKVAYGVRRRYFTHAQLDSVMNYPWRSAILRFCRGEDDGVGLMWAIMNLAENYPADVLNANLNLLSSHDVPRAITDLIDPVNGEREELAQRKMTVQQLELGKKRFKLASFLQFTLPGCPCIYYGDEAGMTGYRDPFNRQYYPWGKEDKELQDHIRRLAYVKQNEILRFGSVQVLEAGDGKIVYRRSYEGKYLTFECDAKNLTFTVHEKEGA